jgi:hypothetical protein
MSRSPRDDSRSPEDKVAGDVDIEHFEPQPRTHKQQNGKNSKGTKKSKSPPIGWAADAKLDKQGQPMAIVANVRSGCNGTTCRGSGFQPFSRQLTSGPENTHSIGSETGSMP